MPPRRRTSNLTRRPRVAGLAPAAIRPGGAPTAPPAEHLPAEPSVGYREPAPVPPPGLEGTEPDRAEVGDDALTARPARAAVLAEDPVAEVEHPRRRARIAALRARPVQVLGVALALFAVLAVGFGVADHLTRNTPAARNTALADVGATADVVGQLGNALETVYSYDFTRLDENERQARDVITPAFAEKFGQLFTQVRQLAPQQQAVVSAIVTTAAVQSIEGDRAVLVAFLDQQATRANAGSEPQQLNAAGRLTVTGELVDGTWRIAEVQNR